MHIFSMELSRLCRSFSSYPPLHFFSIFSAIWAVSFIPIYLRCVLSTCAVLFTFIKSFSSKDFFNLPRFFGVLSRYIRMYFFTLSLSFSQKNRNVSILVVLVSCVSSLVGFMLFVAGLPFTKLYLVSSNSFVLNCLVLTAFILNF